MRYFKVRQLKISSWENGNPVHGTRFRHRVFAYRSHKLLQSWAIKALGAAWRSRKREEAYRRQKEREREKAALAVDDSPTTGQHKPFRLRSFHCCVLLKKSVCHIYTYILSACIFCFLPAVDPNATLHCQTIILSK
jgi:hypothetical protein